MTLRAGAGVLFAEAVADVLAELGADTVLGVVGGGTLMGT